MANGNNHAKQILIDETMSDVKKLENGSAGDIHVIGRVVGKLARITCVMYENDFVTVQACKEMHQKTKGVKKPIKVKVGPFAFEGFITPALLLALPNIFICVGGVFALGRWQGWW